MGSLCETKRNLKNCYYLTEAHAGTGSADTTRDLIEEELNLLGEFYETYERPIVSVDESGSQFSDRITTPRGANAEFPKKESTPRLGGDRP